MEPGQAGDSPMPQKSPDARLACLLRAMTAVSPTLRATPTLRASA